MKSYIEILIFLFNRLNFGYKNVQDLCVKVLNSQVILYSNHFQYNSILTITCQKLHQYEQILKQTYQSNQGTFIQRSKPQYKHSSLVLSDFSITIMLLAYGVCTNYPYSKCYKTMQHQVKRVFKSTVINLTAQIW